MRHFIFVLFVWKLNLNAQMQFYFFPSTYSFSAPNLPQTRPVERKIHHDMKIKFDFSKNLIEVTDSFSIPDNMLGFSFYLHKGLNPVPEGKGISIEPIGSKGILSIESLNKKPTQDSSNFEHYYLESKPGIKTAKIKYKVKIFHPFEKQFQEYAGNFSETTGIISEDTCYLSGNFGFYPRIAKELVTFKIQAELPRDYVIVTQGARLSDVVQGNLRKTTWSEKNPQEDITLLCGKLKEYSKKYKDKRFYVFLRNHDDELATKYLETARQYIEMYSKLLGEYPYKKFSVAENFKETTYSLPSFMLLGPKTIKFPSTLHTSYQREILRNWWGNGVFVDYEQGNWAEGLINYLADHLRAEQKGKDKDYRIMSLQKYSDYVSKSQDFPIIDWNSKYSWTSENIIHVKIMMFYHMLRQKSGNKKFIEALKHFFLKNKFRYATFGHIKDSFEKVLQDDLDYFFDQWLTKPGAPELELKNASVEKITFTHHMTGLNETKYVLKFEIAQKQNEPYDIDVPVVIHFENETQAYKTFVNINQNLETFEIKSSSKPLILEIDPEYDVFRKLNLLQTSSKSPSMQSPNQWNNLTDIGVPTTLSVIFEENIKKLIYPERKPLVYP